MREEFLLPGIREASVIARVVCVHIRLRVLLEL